MPNAARLPHFPTLGQATRVWLRIGCLSFGGPAGQIALMHREVVEARQWIGETRFLHALNFCSLLPGPEAQQLATYLGWLLHGVRGGLIAGSLFVLPGALVMFALATIFVTLGNTPAVEAVFFGIKCAVMVIVLEALQRVARRALKTSTHRAIAATAFIALAAFSLPFPLVIAAAALVGVLAPRPFAVAPATSGNAQQPALLDAVLAADPERATRMAAGARKAGVVALMLWLLPVALLLPLANRFSDVAWFFSKMAVVTFGGAYAVLAYVAQEAVEGYAWLSATDMLTGLGLAETTPGPLILVTQFVAFLAGYGDNPALSGLAGGLLAGCLALWVTFAPCFAFVFLGAPAIEKLQRNAAIAGALAAITAAVVGVIANLALWFGLRVLFTELTPLSWGPWSFDVPVFSTLNGQALLITALAAMALFGLRTGVLKTLLICSVAGYAMTLVMNSPS